MEFHQMGAAMARRRVGIDEVARQAGVSTATVDRVLNGRGGVRPEKEERVIEAARALGLDRAVSLRPVRTLRVGVLIQSPRNPFHASLREGFDLMAGIAHALNMQFLIQHIEPRRPAETAARIAGLVGQRDGLIISCQEDPLIDAALRAFAAGAPVIALVTELANSGRSVYIGPDDRQSGRVAADLMGLYLRPEGGRVVMVAGMLDLAGNRARESGFRALLAERHPETRLVEVFESGELGEEAGRLAEMALRHDPSIRGIYHTSTGATSIVAALEGLGRAHDVVLITHELTPNRRRLLGERRIHAVIDQKPVLEVRLTVEAMARLLGRLEGEAHSITTETQIFMPESLS